MKNATPLLLATVFAIAFLAMRPHVSEKLYAARSHHDTYYLPPSQYLSTLSLGYTEAFADLIWARALVYLGEQYVQRDKLRYVFHYAKAITTLDPNFERIYSWISVAGIYQPIQPTREDFLQTVEFLRIGARRFPENGEIAWALGGTLAYESPSFFSDKRKVSEFKEEALPYLMTAAIKGDGPPWLAASISNKMAQFGRLEQSADQLSKLYSMVDDRESKDKIAQKIQALKSAAQQSGTLAAAKELEENRQRDFPYLGSGHYSLVGRRIDKKNP